MILKNGSLIVFVLTILTFIPLLFYLNKTPNNELEYRQQLGNQIFDPVPQKLLNLSFRYILNNKHVCTNETEGMFAVIIVTSYFGNIETRNSMRQAFNKEQLDKHKLRRVFLLGEARHDKYTTQQSINAESQQFGDIIQGNFSEAYRNLTYKHIMGLKWASTFCANAKYIIKMDDDIVVNMYKLKLMLSSLEKLKRDFIAGYVLYNLKPIREPANKWYVTQKEYFLSSYPSFVSGWFYVTNPSSARKIVALSTYENYFWIDDVFITGIIAKKLKIMQYDISIHFTVNSEFLQCCLQDFEKNIDCDINVGPNGGDPNMFFEFNNQVQRCSFHKCTKRSRPLNETCVAKKKVNLGRGDSFVRDFRLI